MGMDLRLIGTFSDPAFAGRQAGLRVDELLDKVGLQHRRVRVLEELEQKRKAEWVHSVGVEEDSLASDLFLAGIAREVGRGVLEPEEQTT